MEVCPTGLVRQACVKQAGAVQCFAQRAISVVQRAITFNFLVLASAFGGHFN